MNWSAISETKETSAKMSDRQKRRDANPTRVQKMMRHQHYATTEISLEEVQKLLGGGGGSDYAGLAVVAGLCSSVSSPSMNLLHNVWPSGRLSKRSARIKNCFEERPTSEARSSPLRVSPWRESLHDHSQDPKRSSVTQGVRHEIHNPPFPAGHSV